MGAFDGLADKAADATVAGQSNAAPESTEQNGASQDLAPESQDASQDEALTSQDLIDLDKLEKFRLNGEEMTREELAKSMLRMGDYTRKTQEFAKDRKFYDNLSYDIAKCLKNPGLVEQFKKIYPDKFHHHLVEAFKDHFQTKPQAQNGHGRPSVDPQVLDRINQIEGRFREQEVKAAGVMIDGLFTKYTKQYPFADEASVISRALGLMETKQRNGEKDDLSQDEWSKIFKSENDRVEKLAQSRYQEKTKNQINANRKAKDIGRGGDAADAPARKLTFKEATEAAIRDLGGR